MFSAKVHYSGEGLVTLFSGTCTLLSPRKRGNGRRKSLWDNGGGGEWFM